MGLNRSLQKLAKEIDKLRARIAELESAARVLRELEGGELADRKVKQLGKMMAQPDLPIRAKRKITKPILRANGTSYVRVPREIWQGQTLTFLKQHPASTMLDIATGMQASLHATQTRIRKLLASHRISRTGTGTSHGEKMHRYSVR